MASQQTLAKQREVLVSTSSSSGLLEFCGRLRKECDFKLRFWVATDVFRSFTRTLVTRDDNKWEPLESDAADHKSWVTSHSPLLQMLAKLSVDKQQAGFRKF